MEWGGGGRMDCVSGHWTAADYLQLKIRLQGTGLSVVPCGAGGGEEMASVKLAAFRSESSEPVFQQVHL